MRVFNVDISRKGISPVVQVTEYDAMSRFFTLVLRNGSADYEPPEGATYSVWYKTKDSHGWYDTITESDNGTHPAVVADGNAYTIEIAEQATTSCGELALMINGDDGYQLTVSGIITRSDDIPGYDGEEVENYYNVFITRMQENAARAENAADIAVAYGATVEVDEEAQQLNITHHSDTEGGVGWLFGSAVTSEASGSVAAFSDGANDVAVKSLIAEITPVQSGSGDPSPTNVRAISGRTGLTVTAASKNLAPNYAGTGANTTNGITYTYNDDGSITIDGTATANAYSRAVDGVATNIYLPHGTYKKPTLQNGNMGIYVQYRKGASNWVTVTGGATVSQTFVIDEDYPLAIRVAVIGGTTLNNYRFEPYVYPESVNDLTWVSPVKNTFPITWESIAGTVYGGTLDAVSGVLTVDKGFITYDGSENWNWQASDTYKRAACPLSDVYNPGGRVSVQSNAGTFRTSGNDVGTIFASGTTLFYYPDASITSLDAYKTWLASNNLQIVYPLATPQTYQLTPTEVRTLLGGNNIYTDAGAVSVEYVADTKLYIDNKIAELQALILEN